jgi:hypothetical protein
VVGKHFAASILLMTLGAVGLGFIVKNVRYAEWYWTPLRLATTIIERKVSFHLLPDKET